MAETPFASSVTQDWLNLRPEEINWLAPGTEFQGVLELRSPTRFSGVMKGELRMVVEAPLVLDEPSYVEGEVQGPRLLIQGAVDGTITATETLVLARSARVTGTIRCRAIQMEAGAVFDGKLEQL